MKIYKIVWFGNYGNPNFVNSIVYSTLDKAKKALDELFLRCPTEKYYDKVVCDSDFDYYGEDNKAFEEFEKLWIQNKFVIYEGILL